MVQRTGEQGQGNIWFVQNNFYYDAFFLKAIGESSMKRPRLFSNVVIPVLNGGCPSGWCSTEDNSRFHVRSSLKPWRLSNTFSQPSGVSYSGATFKYTVLDTTGQRAAAAGESTGSTFVRELTLPSVAQLPQTAYQSLLTPYSFIGLGRTNNYIENFFVGSTKHDEEHFINMEGVIPNSKVVIIPPSDDSHGTDWRKELYLRPGEWIPLVTLTVVIATVLLAIIVLILHLNEKVGFRFYLLPATILNQFAERGRARTEESFSPHQFRRTVAPAGIYPMYDLLASRLLSFLQNILHHGAVIMIPSNTQQIGGNSRCKRSKVSKTMITNEGQSNSHITSFPTPPKTSTLPSFSNLRRCESKLCAAPSQRFCG